MSLEKSISFIKEAVERNMNKYVLSKVYDFDKYYLIVLDYKTKKADEFVYDPFYLVNKKTYALSGFTPAMNIEAFKKAMKSKPLYER